MYTFNRKAESNLKHANKLYQTWSFVQGFLNSAKGKREWDIRLEGFFYVLEI